MLIAIALLILCPLLALGGNRVCGVGAGLYELVERGAVSRSALFRRTTIIGLAGAASCFGFAAMLLAVAAGVAGVGRVIVWTIFL